MIVWLVIGGGGVLAVLAMALGLAAKGDRYLPQHALDDPAPVYGSMILAEERTVLLPAPGPLEAPLDWREQTAADLSPEALDEEVMSSETASSPEVLMPGLPVAPHVSSGPGGLSSLTPGPDSDGGGSRWDHGPELHVQGGSNPPLPPSRLLRTTGEIMRADLLADVCADIARRDAEVAMWLVDFQQRWAAA